MQEFFETLTEQRVSLVVNWLAVISIVVGAGAGVIAALIRRRMPKDLILGILWGMSGPLLWLVWHLVDARTSYYDFHYQVPGRERWLWSIITPHKVDSVYGLGTLAIGVLVGAVVVGVLIGVLLRYLDRRFPAPQSQ